MPTQTPEERFEAWMSSQSPLHSAASVALARLAYLAACQSPEQEAVLAAAAALVSEPLSMHEFDKRTCYLAEAVKAMQQAGEDEEDLLCEGVSYKPYDIDRVLAGGEGVTKQQARKKAAKWAAGVIQGVHETGGSANIQDGLNDGDFNRVQEAIYEIVNKLSDRGE